MLFGAKKSFGMLPDKLRHGTSAREKKLILIAARKRAKQEANAAKKAAAVQSSSEAPAKANATA
jgi:hypothetical protein